MQCAGLRRSERDVSVRRRDVVFARISVIRTPRNESFVRACRPENGNVGDRETWPRRNDGRAGAQESPGPRAPDGGTTGVGDHPELRQQGRVGRRPHQGVPGAHHRRARGRGQQIDHVQRHHVAQGQGHAPVQVQGPDTGRGAGARRLQHRGAGRLQPDPGLGPQGHLDPRRAHQVQPGPAPAQEDPQVPGDEKSHKGRQVGGRQQENRLHALRPGARQLHHGRRLVFQPGVRVRVHQRTHQTQLQVLGGQEIQSPEKHQLAQPVDQVQHVLRHRRPRPGVYIQNRHQQGPADGRGHRFHIGPVGVRRVGGQAFQQRRQSRISLHQVSGEEKRCMLFTVR